MDTLNDTEEEIFGTFCIIYLNFPLSLGVSLMTSVTSFPSMKKWEFMIIPLGLSEAFVKPSLTITSMIFQWKATSIPG